MLESKAPLAIEGWLSGVRDRFESRAPELLPLFEIYAAEAVFGRSFIASDLERLPSNARVLEVGAGAFLLSCQLMREGFDVTALEPTGSGFSHFDAMRRMVQEQAAELGCLPRMLDFAAEALSECECFEYAFSVNVMEHVHDVALTLEAVGRGLAMGAIYRFTCPNYLFPYEPHFNIPTLFSKRLTEVVFGRRILAYTKIPDPAGTWKSLNWINVPQVGAVVHRLRYLRISFNRRLFVSTLERIVSDPGFASRRSPAMRILIAALVRLHVHRLLQFVPAVLQPVMDCQIRRVSRMEI